MIAGVVAMSIMAHLKMVSPAVLAELQKHPQSVAVITGGDIPPFPEHPTSYAQVRPTLLATARFGALQIGLEDVDLAMGIAKQNAPQFAKQIDADRAAFAEAVKGPQDEIGLQKAWHGIHYLLTGQAEGGPEPWRWAVDGGDGELGPDAGYGPARWSSPARVKKIAAALRSLSPEAFRKRYDAQKLDAADIYPGGWREEPDNADWLVDVYRALREFYLRAAARGDAVLFWAN